MIKIVFEGKELRFKEGITPLEIIKKNKELVKEAIVAKFNNELIDLTKPLTEDGTLRILTFSDKEGKEVFRHSAAHILAQAVKRLFPEAKLSIGPAIEDGFYYDFDVEKPFTDNDLRKIEKEMKKIVNEDIIFERIDVPKEEGKKKIKELKEPYKLELIDELGDEVSFYKQAEFIDLCKGPHVISTGKIKAFKLTKLAGAYWRGKAENKQLQRIYGVAFPTQEELDKYLERLKEAEKRDHRVLGKQLDLFSIHEEGPGFPFFHPKGMIIINLLKEFWREVHKKHHYQEIQTPIVLSKELWVRSGHWEHYKENMYFTKIDERDFAIKPMNCPGCILVYKTRVHSYRELPLRLAEMGIVHRHELSGVLSGLFRVRCFTQDDAHIFLTREQIKDEIIDIIDLVDYFYKIFGFDYHVELSTMPERALGTREVWEIAENALKEALEAKNIDYRINEGEGAFYGPKIDFHIRDCLGRTWQCATIQLDFAMPEKFDISYEAEDGRQHRPVMIHRVIYGSLERFLGILIEQYAGRFPLWLSPEQVRILTVADRFIPYAKAIKEKMKKAGIRVSLDVRARTVNKKVRDAQIAKVPLIVNIGEKELSNKTLAVRTLDGKVRFGIKLKELIENIKRNVKEKKLKIDF